MQKKKKSFGQKLRAARSSRGFRQKKAARIISKSERTLRDWENGRKTPSEMVQKSVLRTLMRSQASPSMSELKKAGRLHHIAWEKDRGWFMRVTIEVGSKIVGHRVKVRLKTRDIEDAVRSRDVVLSAYRAMGFKVANITNCRKRKSAGTTPLSRRDCLLDE